MSRIQLADTGFSIIEEGEHVFKITKVEYKKDFDKMIVTCETEDGKKQIERFMLNNEGGIKAFSYLAKTALNDFTLSEIDENDLLGCYFVGVVEHTELPSNKDPNKTVTFSNIKEKHPVDDDFMGWDSKKAESKPLPKVVKESNDSDDLDDILG